ncbi:MAG: alpha-1,2-fucosyltransferase [Spirosomataceae bacterium]
MIIVRLRGGLGNQLFQYALGRHLALLNQTELKLDISLLTTPYTWTRRQYQLDAFVIKATVATRQEIAALKGKYEVLSRLLRFLSPQYYREPCFEFDDKVLSLRGSFYLDGYWQSEKYFEAIASLLRTDLRPEVALSANRAAAFGENKNTIAVSIHLRCVAIISFCSKANRYLQPCSMDYYENAIGYMAKEIENPTFFVFSDDISWVRENLKVPFQVHFIEGYTPQEDLWMMAACRHHIIANSTFSWWGAWLNPGPYKTVIAPQRWFATERFNTQDLLPTKWIRL